jgi:predicted acyl esterase
MRYLLLFSLFLSTNGLFAQMTPTYDDILIPMRDGLFLEADIYIPAGVDSAEVVLIQTPYNKDFYIWSLPMGVGMNVDTQPFIWVIVDWRGFYGSLPAAIAQPNRGEDGYDVCEWITEQLWHKDRIGTWGPSALGGVQYNLARENHPNHTCAVPLVAHAHQSYDAYFYGGVLEKARLEQLDALGYGLSPVILANTYYSSVWQFSESSTWFAPDIKIPTLQIGGWYDHNIDKMMDVYASSRTDAGAAVLDQQWLLVGPWVHGGSGAAYVGSAIQGELSYANAEFKSDTMAWDFLQYYLLDTPNNWQNTDFITYYETGLDQWATSNATSIESPTTDVLYLNASNQLVSGNAIGSTTFVSDPSNPSPTIGGATLNSALDQGPYDQISLESRNDIITFSTGELSQDVTVSGRITIDIYVESDQEDCDISVRLVDVYPDNRNMLITDGIARMRFRNGYTQADETFMSPGNVYTRQIELPFTNFTWLAGHKIKIYIGGNNASRYDVNLQNGGTMYTASDTNVANITVHHNALYPSSITLPGSNSFLGSDDLENIRLGVYPNPAKETLKIDTDLTLENIKIIDLSGRIIQTHEVSLESIEIGNLKSGVYLIRVSDGIRTIERRFVKL